MSFLVSGVVPVSERGGERSPATSVRPVRPVRCGTGTVGTLQYVHTGGERVGGSNIRHNWAVST